MLAYVRFWMNTQFFFYRLDTNCSFENFHKSDLKQKVIENKKFIWFFGHRNETERDFLGKVA